MEHPLELRIIGGARDPEIVVRVDSASSVRSLKTEIVRVHSQRNAEHSAQGSVRLIYSGRELRDDDTLTESLLLDGAVIHAVWNSTPRPQANSESVSPDQSFFIAKVILLLIPGAGLGIFYYLLLKAPEYFNAGAKIMLVGLTFLYCGCVDWRRFIGTLQHRHPSSVPHAASE